MNDCLMSSDKMNWETPQELFDKLNNEFNFTLDPCSSETNHKCEKFFTLTENGLEQIWDNEVSFVNPPYGREIGKWVKKASETNGTVVMLIPARTDTIYWHDYIFKKANEIRFIKGRIKFIDPDTKLPKESAPFPSAIIVFNGVRENLKVSAIKIERQEL